MISLRETLLKAKKEHKAIGHFNVSQIEFIRGVCYAAQRKQAPVILGVSEGERNFLGLDLVVWMVKKAREEFTIPIFLNADHTHTIEGAYKAIDAGCDAVLFDAASKSLEENITDTKKVKEYIDTYNKEKGADILLEAEIGYIGSSSTTFDTLPEGVSLDAASLTTPQQAEQFIKETGVDLFAPAVGNIHGMYKDRKNPELDIERIKDIAKIVSAGLVLHGGSGISDQNMKDAIEAGISIIHVSTELRVAWKEGIEEALKRREATPYTIASEGQKNIENVVEKKLELYGWN